MEPHRVVAWDKGLASQRLALRVIIFQCSDTRPNVLWQRPCDIDKAQGGADTPLFIHTFAQ
jgi:hypothetical protein